MTQQRRAYEIFKRSAEIPETEVEDFLVQACAKDLELRKQVEKLLSLENDAEVFLPEGPSRAPTNLAELRPAEDPQLNTTVGPYKLLKEIGEGGFGIVYMAEQLAPIRRQVALKIIKPGMDTRDVIARFEAERQSLAMMDHTNIARMFEAGQTENGRPYFVMELVKGVPITEFCDKHNLHTDERLELIISVCHAVQHAHQKGVIHRDLKPSNIMVTLDEVPVAKVIDFGVSKAISQRLTEKSFVTQFGQMIGTPQYMSPEQVEVSGLDIDTRSDVYSLGVVLYELLTGTTPLDAERLRTVGYGEMQRIIQEEEPPKPSTRISTLGKNSTVASKQRRTDARRLRKTIRGDLDWIVMKAIEKRRDHRYETAAQFAQDIQRHLNEEPVMAGPPSAMYLISKLARRHKVAFFTSVVVAASLAIGFAAVAWGFVNANYYRGIAEARLARAELAESDAITQRDKARKQNYRLHLAAADEAILNDDPFRCYEALQSCPPGLRDWGWWFVKQRLDNAPFPFVILGKLQPIYTPDGKYLIAAGVNGSADEHNVMIWDLATRSIVGKYDAERRLSALAMSPNGNFLAGGGADGTLILWNRETRRRLWVAKEHKKHFDCLSLRDDGLVAAANSDGTLKVFEPSDGNVRFWLSLEDPKLRGALGLDPEPRKVMFSPNGRWIAVGSKPPKIGQQLVNSKPAEIIDAATGRQVAQFGDGHFLPTFSPDRNTIATARLDNRYSTIVLSSWDGNDLTNERSWQVGKDVNAPVYDLCFNANGEHLAAMRRQDDLDVWDVKTTTEIASWGGLFRANWLTIHPKKGQLAFCHVDRRIHLWNYARQDPEATVTKLDEPARLVKFSPDGKLIAVGSVADHRNFSSWVKLSDSAGIVTVLDTAAGIVVCKFNGRLVNSPWLPDSERIVVLGLTNSFEIWNTQTGILDRSVRETIEDKFSAFVDGRTVTSVERRAGGPRIRIWDTDTGELITDFLAEVEGAGKSIVAGVPDFNHQDKRVAIGNMNSKIEIWDTESQSLTRTLKTLGRLHFVLRFSRDGNRLFIGELGGHGLAVQDFESEREFQFQGVSSKIPSFAVSPDGAQLVAQTEIVDNSDAKKLTVYDVATSQPLVTLLSSSEAQRKGPGGPAQFDWSADGQRIAAILPMTDELYIWTLPQVP